MKILIHLKNLIFHFETTPGVIEFIYELNRNQKIEQI